jgi:hypothetical protein
MHCAELCEKQIAINHMGEKRLNGLAYVDINCDMRLHYDRSLTSAVLQVNTEVSLKFVVLVSFVMAEADILFCSR